MTYDVIPTPKFLNDIKYYERKKKYRHIADDVNAIVEKLECGNLVGDELSGLQGEIDGHTYKVRSVNTDAHVGESNGYRIIYYVITDDHQIFLITIYSKKDDYRIPSDSEIIAWVKMYCID